MSATPSHPELKTELNIGLSTVVVRVAGKVSADLAGEAAILDPEKGLYFGLNEVGARIWHHIGSPKTVEEIRDLILEEYEVDEERCFGELVELLTALEKKGLLERA